MYVQCSKRVCSQRIQHSNLNTTDLLLEITDCPVFNERYLNIENIYTQSLTIENLTRVVYFLQM